MRLEAAESHSDGKLLQPPKGIANPESRKVLHSLRAASLAPASLARAALRSFPHFARFRMRHSRV